MVDTLTISRKPPASTSMDFVALREIGIQRIQEIAGLLWTDYNTHDPGITMLEVMSYVITDIGYRANYDIKDLLTQAPGSITDIKNFYTACEILPVCPVTFNDYRKLLIDVEVVDEDDELCKHAGVKNAWIQKSGAKIPGTSTDSRSDYQIHPAEQKIYVDRKYSKLSLDPIENIPAEKQECFYAKTLYDVLLEFDKCDRFGDLNSSFSELNFNHTQPEDPFRVTMRVDFARWDEQDIDWNAPLDYASHIEKIRLRFPDLSGSNELVLKGGLALSNIIVKQGGLDFVSASFLNYVDQFVLQLFNEYKLKIGKILEIVAAVRAKLQENRNLCDDYYRINALKVEEILLCSDIELTPEADVEKVEAEILFQIANFLSPKVNFYTLHEMLNRCRRAIQYPLSAINKNKSIFTLTTKLEKDINQDDTITVLASEDNLKEYTVKCIRTNRENPNFTDIEVQEEVRSDEIGEHPYLIKGTIDEDRCLTVDNIFEGPKLKHGFIDDEELARAERMKYIHVSDLIRIIMDVEGVVAVKNIQIANRPEDNDDNIPSQSVKWCLKLAFENNYVPRLNTTDSILTFYKDQIPFIGKHSDVEAFIDILEKEERPQKIYYPDLDIPVPQGEYLDVEDYTSLQEDLPTVYGVSSRGLPGLGVLEPTQRELRKAQAKQLKGFLIFFDQLMANYLSQLEHVKDLFSMSSDKDAFGNYTIDKTYFSQSLVNVVPNASPLYVNTAGHILALEQIVEDKALYEKRRNKFLDHLLGRFAETFTDYAMLIYQASGAKAPAELIEDKLNFLESYPELSASRGKGFNYLHPCLKWHIDNLAGLEQRASLLLGMPERAATSLAFNPYFKIIDTAGDFTFGIYNAAETTILLKGPVGPPLDTEEKVKLLFERILISGSCRKNYTIQPSDAPGEFYFQLLCDGEILAVSEKIDFSSDTPGGDADLFIIDLIENIILPEYCDNHEANRKNLAPPIFNYFTYTVTAVLVPPDGQPPQYEIDYLLYDQPFAFTNDHLLLSGKVIGAAKEGDTVTKIEEEGNEAAMKLLCDVVAYGTKHKNYAFDTIDDPYTLILCNRTGTEIGRYPLKDYNETVSDEINSLSQITIGTGNDFNVNSATDQGSEVEIVLTSAPAGGLKEQPLSYTQSFPIVAIDLLERTIEATLGSVTRIFPEDKIEIASGANEGIYTIRAVDTSGANAIIHVKEEIPTTDLTGVLQIFRTYEITNIVGTSVFIKGGDDQRLILFLMDFFTNKFASNEGMHIIEHTLLRPRINEKLWKSADAQTLDDSILNKGQICFEKTVPIETITARKRRIIVSGNLKNELNNSAVKIVGGSPNDGSYTMYQRKYIAAQNKTMVRVKEPFIFDLPDPNHAATGELSFIRTIDITNVDAATRKIILNHADAQHITSGDIIQIKDSGSQNKNNDGRYQVESVTNTGGDNYGIIISEYEYDLQDSLLSIHIDKEDCDSCNIVDPYSCIVSVVLPYWAGKFTNVAIRKFIERTIRLEAPAHLLLNICWVDCDQMAELECKFKKWLIQIGKKKKDKEPLVKALSDLIDIIDRLRNIHPSGTLHSCDDDDTFEDAVILNNSVLGTF